MNFDNHYTPKTKMDNNAWITDPRVEDPKNLPRPLGWQILVRPYPIKQSEGAKIIIGSDEFNFLNHITNIGRVVDIGDCAWNRSEHKMKDGTQKDWLKVGDFVSYPRNTGARRKFKGVTYVLLVDDEICEQLPDPQIFDEGYYKIDIPQEHLEKYNTVFQKEVK